MTLPPNPKAPGQPTGGRLGNKRLIAQRISVMKRTKCVRFSTVSFEFCIKIKRLGPLFWCGEQLWRTATDSVLAAFSRASSIRDNIFLCRRRWEKAMNCSALMVVTIRTHLGIQIR